MSATLSTIVKTGGDFITRSAAGGTVASGAAAGTVLTLTPLAGQRIRLTHLSTAAAQTVVGLSVLLGSDVVIDDLTLDGDTPNSTSNFSVGKYQPYAAGTPPLTNYSQFTGKVGEALTLVKTGGVTNTAIYYGYEYGL